MTIFAVSPKRFAAKVMMLIVRYGPKMRWITAQPTGANAFLDQMVQLKSGRDLADQKRIYDSVNGSIVIVPPDDTVGDVCSHHRTTPDPATILVDRYFTLYPSRQWINSIMDHTKYSSGGRVDRQVERM